MSIKGIFNNINILNRQSQSVERVQNQNINNFGVNFGNTQRGSSAGIGENPRINGNDMANFKEMMKTPQFAYNGTGNLMPKHSGSFDGIG